MTPKECHQTILSAVEEQVPQYNEVIARILSNKRLMADLRESARAVARGERGRPWSEVKKELGLK